MNAADMSRWTTALRRLAACYNKTLTTEQADAWFEQLERYPIDAIEQAMRDAPAHDDAGQYMPSVGLVEKITRKHMAGKPRTTGDWHAPEVMRDEDGRVTVAYRCGLCCDTGWRGVVTETGMLLTEAELQEWELRHKPAGPREDGRPHITRRRCPCKTGGQVREVAA